MSRVAYFKGINQNGLDEAQSALITTLQGQYSTLSTTVQGKADSSVVTQALALKADASALSSKADVQTVNTALASKANAQDVNIALALKQDATVHAQDVATINASIESVNTALTSKANASEITSINNSIGAVNNSLALKLDATVHSARVNNETQFFDAFKEVVYLSNANNTAEFDYAGLGLGTAPVVPPQ